jgi:hypothetical protein
MFGTSQLAAATGLDSRTVYDWTARGYLKPQAGADHRYTIGGAIRARITAQLVALG